MGQAYWGSQLVNAMEIGNETYVSLPLDYIHTANFIIPRRKLSEKEWSARTDS